MVGSINQDKEYGAYRFWPFIQREYKLTNVNGRAKLASPVREEY